MTRTQFLGQKLRRLWRCTCFIGSLRFGPDMFVNPLDTLKQLSDDFCLKVRNIGRVRTKHDIKGGESHLIWGILYPVKSKGNENQPVTTNQSLCSIYLRLLSELCSSFLPVLSSEDYMHNEVSNQSPGYMLSLIYLGHKRGFII